MGDAPYSLDSDNLAGGDVYSSERIYGDVSILISDSED